MAATDERFRLRPSRRRGSTGSASTSRCPFRSRASCAAFGPTPCSSQGIRRRPRRPARPGARSAPAKRRSSRCTATGASRRGCTARKLRRLLNPLADALAAWAAPPRRRSPARSPFTSRAGASDTAGEPDAVFPAWMRSRARSPIGPPAPLPGRPTALFVGALERYKSVDGLAAAWPRVAAWRGGRAAASSVGSRLEMIERLLAQCGSVEHDRVLSPRRSRGAWTRDRARPSVPLRRAWSRRDRGVPRGRGVVGGSSGGILDLVDDGVTGILVDAGRRRRARRTPRFAYSPIGRLLNGWAKRRKAPVPRLAFDPAGVCEPSPQTRRCRDRP